MATRVEIAPAAAGPALAPRLTLADEVLKFIRTKPLGAAGAAIILGLLIVAALARAVAPYDPYEANYALQFARPSAEHWLGTDEFGRDLLSRILYGARIALFVGFTASFLGCTLGGLLGVISAYLGGKVDLLLERLMDILLAFPQLILALAIASILGPAVQNVVIAIAIPIIPRAARVVRATALSVKENVYVEAVAALGAARRRIVLRHIVPNVVAPYIKAFAPRGVSYVGEGELSRFCKIAHNVMLGVVIQNLAEITILAEKAGVPRHAFLEFMNNGVMGSMFTRYKSNALVNLDWTTTFTPELLRKDLDLGLEAGRRLDVPMPVTAATREALQAHFGAASLQPDPKAYIEKDFAATLETVALAAGIKLKSENVPMATGLET